MPPSPLLIVIPNKVPVYVLSPIGPKNGVSFAIPKELNNEPDPDEGFKNPSLRLKPFSNTDVNF